MDADVRCQIDGMFRSTLADPSGLLVRESCIEFLRSIGGTSEEANALLRECDRGREDTHISVTTFLDVLCGPTEPPKETEGSAEQAPPSEARGEEAPLDAGKLTEPAKEPPFVQTPKVQSAPAERLDEKPQIKETEVVRELVEEPSEKDLAQESADSVDPKKEAAEEAGTTAAKESEDARVDKDDPNLTTTATTATAEGTQEDESTATLPTPAGDVKEDDACVATGVEPSQEPTDFGWFYESYRLVQVKEGKRWKEMDLLQAWNAHPIPRWPPRMPPCGPVSQDGDPTNVGDSWVPVHVHVNPGLVGQWARQCTREYRPYPGEKMRDRYKIEHAIGAGHFTRAYLATDLETNTKVCIKRHNGLTVELLTDLLTISRRIQSVDPEFKCFSRLVEAFFDMVGYTVETLFEGRNCTEICRTNPMHFKELDNLRVVAVGCLRGLKLLSDAGVVHCDMKADNFMWTKTDDGEPTVRIVDFGCSRLDSRLESGRNWAFAEGGAGHIGKWAPEMMLRIPVTDKADVWGHAVALMELYSGRNMWNEEEDTVEYMLAQALGLVNQKAGLPEKLLRRSPLDIRQLYTPSPAYFPVQRIGVAPNVSFKELRPATWGLACVLGDESKWDDGKKALAEYVCTAMQLDPDDRPSALDLMSHKFVGMEAEAAGAELPS
mmetsp:Transcript_53899/g.101000  ORF Transcript_53899/g.101000 Transcript_53899/m.101000 type:complete len:663 (+) Transcript_53899:118-2106(+)